MIPIALGLLLSFVSAAYDYDKTFKDHRLRWGFRCVATPLFAFIGGHTFIKSRYKHIVWLWDAVGH